jgi:ABC-type sugar transport system substrate-binding protein
VTKGENIVRKSRSLLRLAMAATVAALAALTVAACGSSSNSNSSSSGGSSTSSTATAPGLAAAQAYVNSHQSAPTSIGPTKPVGKPIPSGKTIDVINCGPEGCTRAVDAFVAAAKVLGWTTKVLTPAQPTPQLIQADFQQAVNDHPSAVVSTALPVVAFQRQAAALKAAGIPLVSIYGPDPTGGDITLQVFGADGDDELAQAAAYKTAVDLNCKGTVGTVILSGYAIIAQYVGAYTADMKKLCPSVGVKSITIQPTSLGSTDGTDIVNFLRANPGISALLLGYEGVGGDLITAAKSAGITLPKTYSIATTAEGLQAVLSGERTATVPADYATDGWLAADALARIFTGQTASALKEDTMYPTPVIWTQSNAPKVSANTFPPLVANYQSQFMKLWGK